jgi:imidazolonepropionase-like amidohydrolase
MIIRRLLLLWGVPALLLLSRAPTAGQDRLAITSVTVVNVADGSLQRHQTVVIEGDRIAVVGDADEVEVPAGAAVIDGSGKFLIPGLWDMHVHTGNDRNTREVVYPLYVAHGVTGIRNMSADCFDCPMASIEQVYERRRAVAAGDLIGPRVVASSDFAGSHEQAARRPTEGSSPQAPGTEADARAFVRLAKERGVDFIKVYDMLPQEAYFALVEEAKRLGLPFAGHVPVAVRASDASNAGQASIEHMRWVGILNECSVREDELRAQLITELNNAEMGSRQTSQGPALLPLMLEMVATHDPETCAALAERFVRNRTWLVPNLMTARLPGEPRSGWREDPYARFLIPEERRYFERAEEIYARDLGDAEEQAPVSRWAREATGAMHRTGVPMLAGSDAGAWGIFWGIGLHQELELLVSAGFTEAEALRAATLGPAEFLEATDSLGTVKAGQVADLVLLEANPLEDISNTQRISVVVLGGHYLDREALDALLAAAEEAASAPEGEASAQPPE